MQDLIGDSYTDIYINIYATAQEELEDYPLVLSFFFSLLFKTLTDLEDENLLCQVRAILHSMLTSYCVFQLVGNLA